MPAASFPVSSALCSELVRRRWVREEKGRALLVKKGMSPGPVASNRGAMQCALKLRRLRRLFRSLSREWSLEFAPLEAWPGLVLVHRGIFTSRCLELFLQRDFLENESEFYEFGFAEHWRPTFGGGERQRFCCGRLYADDLLCERRVRRELAHKAMLLGLADPRKVGA